MAGFKETPRQKMISMMYLVLTALLALNVSKSILDAFLVVNESMEVTNRNFEKKISDTYTAFEKAWQINQNKVGPYWDKAQQAKQLSEDLRSYIENIKAELISKVDQLPMNVADTMQLINVKGKDNFDIPTNYFMGDSQDGSKGKGIELKNRLIKYKQDIKNLVDPKNQASLKLGLEIKEGKSYKDGYNKKQNWQMYHFYHTIVTADIAILNKMIAEGYIYLRSYNVVKGKVLVAFPMKTSNITEYSHLFIGKNEIYDNGWSEIWK